MATREQFDVLIVGAGPAGIAAACAASSSAKVGMVDDNPAPGGQIWRGGKPPAGDRLAIWLNRFAETKIERLLGTQIISAPVPNVLRAERNGESVELHYDKLIVATGARERFLPFPGWTLPNVVGAGGLQALLKAGLPVEGKRVIVAGSGPLLLSVAAYAKQRGALVTVVAEQAPRVRVAAFGAHLLWLSPSKLWQGAGYRWLLRTTRYVIGCWPTAAHGSAKVEAVTLQTHGRSWTEPCDILACGFGLVPNLELPIMLGCQVRDQSVVVDARQQSNVAGVYCAGEITGVGGAELAVVEGQIAGLSAVGKTSDAAGLFTARSRGRRFAAALDRAFALRRELRDLPDDDTFVCRCEDVTYRQLQGFTSWRAAKLQTRCGMGPCQGRVCGGAVDFLFGWKNESVRPPVLPASVETLAGQVETQSKQGQQGQQ
jgi:NADPH-dependent 2,4-dienoyl-CoA reductase/sulfur reductase-like enzyme